MEENAQNQQFGVLDSVETATVADATNADTAVVDQVPTQDTVSTATPEVDPALTQYRQMITSKGETGRLTGQIKEVEVNGQPVILVHPGLKTAMGIAAKSSPSVALLFDVPYATALIKNVVRYPKEMQNGGLDYFDEHPELLQGVLSEADKFLGKFAYSD